MKILITGAQGQLGQALQKVFSDHQVLAAGRDQLDISRLEDVRSFLGRHPVDWIFNSAAYNFVDQAETDGEAALKANVTGPRNLAIASEEKSIPLLHVSSDYVFDGLAGKPYREDDVPNPLSVYGKSKLNGEREVAEHNSRHLIVRTAWVYSVTGKNFCKTMIGLGLKGDVRVVSDQLGSPTYAPHLAQGIRKLVESRTRGLYHLAGSGGTSWCGLTSCLFELLRLKSKVQPVSTAEFPRPAKRPVSAVLETGREPRVELPFWQEGVRAFADEIHPYLEELKS